MNENRLSLVKDTRRKIRYEFIKTVFNQFDREIMGLDEEKRKRKYGQMLESPFRFYRGSAYLFYYDITRIPFSYHTPADKPTWIQGDLHFENFGAFQDASGRIVYDVNDFDEGYIGSYMYDILRMTVSIALFCEQIGLERPEQEERIATFLRAYYRQLQRFERGKDDPVTLIFHKKNTDGPVHKMIKKLTKRQKHHLLDKMTTLDDRQRRVFRFSDEVLPVPDDERDILELAWEQYLSSLDPEDRQYRSYYRIKDVARKIGSGTASIGLKRYYVLVEGGGSDQGLDDLVLEVKEVRSPIPSYFLPYNESFWKKYPHQGERVIVTQKAMHHNEDPLLGYLTIDGSHFYVRERSPYKKKIKSRHIQSIDDLDEALETMGRITAKIHARADADVDRGMFPYNSEKEILKAIGDDFETFSTQVTFVSMVCKDRVCSDFWIFSDWCRMELGIERDAQRVVPSV